MNGSISLSASQIQGGNTSLTWLLTLFQQGEKIQHNYLSVLVSQLLTEAYNVYLLTPSVGSSRGQQDGGGRTVSEHTTERRTVRTLFQLCHHLHMIIIF